MRQHVQQHLGFLRTTLLGGVVFLLPLAVVGWLLAQGVQILGGVYTAVMAYLAGHPEGAEALKQFGPGSYALLIAATIGLLVGACFVAGIIARRSLGQWFTTRAERYLLMLFPRYAVFKDQLTGNLGGATLKPAVVRIGPHTRIGMEVERDAAGRVTVYLPSSPDPWSGTVEIVDAENLTLIDGEFIDVMTTFEQLGRGIGKYLPEQGEPRGDSVGGVS